MHGDGHITNGVVAQLGAAVASGFRPRANGRSPCYLPYPWRGAEIRRLLQLAAFLGAPPLGELPEFPLLPEDARELDEFGADPPLPAGHYVCLHPGARAAERRWPPHCYAAVGDALYRTWRLPLVLTGSDDETELVRTVSGAMQAPVIEAAGPFSAGALALLLARARLVVCNDTGASHLAAALATPSVVVFRASDAARWAPLDRCLHRPVWDPGGNATATVLTEAHRLLAHPVPLTPPFRAATV